ncbi:MAG: LysE/ArgO family amino acid transporter [Trueperaceae bacterium]
MQSLVFGFVTGLGLIVAIGAQNVFVLRQGIARRNVLPVAATAALVDAVLISVGVAGVGSVVASAEWLARLAGIGGALFLVGYGLVALRSAFGKTAPEWHTGDLKPRSARRAVGATLAISLFNPHVYLDTLVLLGGIGGQLEPGGRVAFTVGAVIASVVWFFSLAYGARTLTPWFPRPVVRRALDVFVAGVMFTVAGYLVLGLLPEP